MIEPSARAATLELVGRDVERERVDGLVDGLRHGGTALLVRGEPGIGKSALLVHARGHAQARGIRVLSTVGAESEAELAFAGLHELLRPITDRLTELPGPQRRALESAFGLADDDEPDPFRLALAAYGLVCAAADTGPVLVLVDDVQRLDRSSLTALTFLARRLEGEPIGLLVAVRSGYATPLDDARLPELPLGPLSPAAAVELLGRRAPDLEPGTRDGVLEQADGNPLALVELVLAPPSAGRLTPAPATLTARLERAFADRLAQLTPPAAAIVLAAALDTAATLDEVLAAATLAGGGGARPASRGFVDQAARLHLVEVGDGRLRFRHPLVRSAVRQRATPAQVLATYAALAEVVADPERRLWHRAMATTGPDDALGQALDDHAMAARRRGAVTVAAVALERAATLSGDPRVRGERLVRAAELAHDLGLVDEVRRLLDQVDPAQLGTLESARLAWLRELVAGDLWSEAGATRTFVAIAERMREGGDPQLALRTLVPIAHRCWWTRSQTRTREYLVATAAGLGVPPDDPQRLVVEALAHPVGSAASVRRRVHGLALADHDDPVAAMAVGIAAEKAGDFATGARFLARAVDGLREGSRLGLLTQALTHYAWAATYTDDWLAATAAGAEAVRLARDTRQPQFGLTGALVAALATAPRAGEEEIDALLREPERRLRAMKGGPLLAPAHLARGAVALSEARPDDAWHHLWPVFDAADPAYHQFMRWPAVLDLVQAGARGAQADRAAAVLAELEAVCEHAAPPILVAGLACARPLLCDDAAAEALFLDALALDLTAHPFLRARTLLSHGQWLRRRRRIADSRAPLRGATDVFDALGAVRWAERARQELRATGEKIGPRTPEARDHLTAQELQIAQLAAEGLSNREIGERLFLSRRTIGSHLYRIFPKLGITARAQVAAALDSHVTQANPDGGQHDAVP